MSGIFYLLMMFAGPICQIAFSCLRIRDRIRFSIGQIAVFGLIAGIAFSVFAAYIWLSSIPYSDGFRCIPPPFFFALPGLLLSVIITPIVGLIGHSNYKIKHPAGAI